MWGGNGIRNSLRTPPLHLPILGIELTFKLPLNGIVMKLRQFPVECPGELFQFCYLLVAQVALGPRLQENNTARFAVPAMNLQVVQPARAPTLCPGMIVEGRDMDCFEGHLLLEACGKRTDRMRRKKGIGKETEERCQTGKTQNLEIKEIIVTSADIHLPKAPSFIYNLQKSSGS